MALGIPGNLYVLYLYYTVGDEEAPSSPSKATSGKQALQGWAKEMELSCEKVSARLQPAIAGHARLVLSKQLEQIYTSLYIYSRNRL